MKKRSTEILERIIRGKLHGASIAGLAQKYHVTQRTLRNDIAEINDFLSSIHVPEILYEGGHLKVPAGIDSRVVQQELYAMDFYLYKLSPVERKIYIEAVLIQKDGYFSMQSLAETLFVNRITILNDVDAVRDDLGSLGIALVSDAGKGIRLDCPMQQKMELLIHLFRQITVNIESNGFFQRLVLEKLAIRHSFSRIFSLTSEYAEANNLVFLDETFYEIVLYIFAFFQLRVPDGDGKEAVATGAMEGMMVYVGRQLEEPVSGEAVEAFRGYLDQHDFGTFVKSIDELELYKVIRYFLANIDRSMGLHIGDDSLLIDSLLLHIKRLKNWGSLEVELPEDAGTGIDYRKIEAAVNEQAHILEKFLSYKLSTNMKRSIVIHICVALIRNHRYTSQLSVAVVCPGSMAMGKYLEAQVKNYFDFKIVGVYPASEVLHRLKAEGRAVDIIISTVPIVTEEYPVIRVDPFMSMEDMNRLQKLSFECQRRRGMAVPGGGKPFSCAIREMLRRENVPLHLGEIIEQTIADYERSQPPLTAIASLLQQEFVLEGRDSMDWREALRLSAGPLIRNGDIEEKYIEKAIENVEEYGDYIVVSPGIALAHANKDCGVHRDALSLLVMRQGVILPEGSDVRLIFCFASTGAQEYLELLREIVSIGRSRGFVEHLLSLDCPEIFQALRHPWQETFPAGE